MVSACAIGRDKSFPGQGDTEIEAIQEKEQGKTERMTFNEMKKKYKDEWLLIGDCEIDDDTELASGVVIAHDRR